MCLLKRKRCEQNTCVTSCERMSKNAEQARLPNQQLVSLSQDKTTNYSHGADSIISSVVSSENQDSFSWVEVTGVGCYRRVRVY